MKLHTVAMLIPQWHSHSVTAENSMLLEGIQEGIHAHVLGDCILGT
jgi:hypothetical protein